MWSKVFKLHQSIRWRLGYRVAASQLEEGSDASVLKFYNERITHCEFLDDPGHYEFPRSKWVSSTISGGALLEIGCGNGGMTRLLAQKVDHLTAFDVSEPSLRQVREMNLPNVITIQGLIEKFKPENQFDWVLMSEVIEHLRDPQSIMNRAYELVLPGGSLVLTTPNGHWESDEHLHEFSMESLSVLISRTGCESFRAAYLRDRENKQRWLVAVINKPNSPPESNDFFDRRSTARKRLRDL